MQRGPEEAPAALVELTREECLALLANHIVGRIAVIGRDNMPLVVPVNYRLKDDTVVFRTDAGSKLDALQRHPVAFQIDSFDLASRTCWSVLVQGIAHDVAPAELGAVDVRPWLEPKPRWIQIVPRLISGRRIALVDDAEVGAPPAGEC